MVAKVTIGKGVLAENIPGALMAKVKKDLTFDNPAYINAMEHGTYVSPNTPAQLYLWEAEGSDVWVPRGYIYWLLKWMKEFRVRKKLIDKTLLLEPCEWKFKGTLRDYQKLATTDLAKYPCDVLEASTGSGKTVMGLYMITVRKQPTLIIVHSKELLYQWRDRIEEFIGIPCGLVGDGKCKIEPITVGIINSVRTRVDQLEPHFGHIIVDECHRITTESWADTVQDFRARYFLGLTATPFRSDGLGNAIFACLGPVKHKVSKKKLQTGGAVLVPKIHRVTTRFRYNFTNDYSTMVSELASNENRNQLITSKIVSDFKKYKENILFISDRQKQLKIVQEMLSMYDIKSHVLTGSVKASKRKDIIQEVREGHCKVLNATTSLIGEGFDAPELVALFMGTPIKFSGRLIQACGRILRPKKGKIPRIYDFRDESVNVLLWSGFARDKIYKKEWNK